MVASIELTPGELSRGALRLETLQTATTIFEIDGCLQIHNCFPRELILQLQEEYTKRYHQYFEDRKHQDALKVGDKRFMITIDIEGVFNDPRLYGNPFFLPILYRILGGGFTLMSFGSVVSLAGSEEQHFHRDHPALFQNDVVDVRLPGFAVTVIIPLVEMNAINGTTRMWPKSHRLPMNHQFNGNEGYDPVAPIGSCLLMDYRLWHGGTANKSSNIRPILYNIYSRPWFRDCINYVRQPELIIKPNELEKVPKDLQKLFALGRLERDWTKDTENIVSKRP